MSEAKKSKKTKKQIIDVQKPGSSTPSTTSKPVIVTNRPLLQDPMVVDRPADEDEPKPPTDKTETMLTSSHEATIKPLDRLTDSEDSDSQEQVDVSVASDTSPAASTAEAEPEPLPEAEPTPAGDNRPSEDTDAEPAAAVAPNQTEQDQRAPETEPPAANEAESGAEATKSPVAKQTDAEAAAKAKHQAEVRELAESRRYALPINAVEERKSRRFVTLGTALAIILILIWLDIALDADIIKLGGLKSLTHFFSN